ncbi:methylated-DNA--[protein]-cysteine S-methyltransferase [Niabella soli]|uniref:Methylated-DNA--protein-cysteine methyltransferase n=1 Tax=Niabella soli DSM 19437 TaxID=929713 RepID=W0F596_9BACT|nr:methylated-DNA--[protein]-cysteine S-methyltransferase [Niabella soli]AHF16983.1 methylated-DNA--protein-cysteine methyltransferase [Niabella soli DSM 19437]
MTQYVYKEITSPTGPLRLITDGKHLIGVLWKPFDDAEGLIQDAAHPVLVRTEEQLAAYFAGKRQQFELPLKFIGTDFQKRVWELLLDIPFGQTISYGEMAKRVGDIKTVRAVGGALNKNPIPIIVPCHRVVGSDGKMVGFGGGVANKIYLLDLENPKQQLALW